MKWRSPFRLQLLVFRDRVQYGSTSVYPRLLSAIVEDTSAGTTAESSTCVVYTSRRLGAEKSTPTAGLQLTIPFQQLNATQFVRNGYGIVEATWGLYHDQIYCWAA